MSHHRGYPAPPSDLTVSTKTSGNPWDFFSALCPVQGRSRSEPQLALLPCRMDALSLPLSIKGKDRPVPFTYPGQCLRTCWTRTPVELSRTRNVGPGLRSLCRRVGSAAFSTIIAAVSQAANSDQLLPFLMDRTTLPGPASDHYAGHSMDPLVCSHNSCSVAQP